MRTNYREMTRRQQIITDLAECAVWISLSLEHEGNEANLAHYTQWAKRLTDELMTLEGASVLPLPLYKMEVTQ